MIKKVTIVLTSILFAFIILSSGYGAWEKTLTITGEIEVVPDPDVLEDLEEALAEEILQEQLALEEAMRLAEEERLAEELRLAVEAKLEEERLAEEQRLTEEGKELVENQASEKDTEKGDMIIEEDTRAEIKQEPDPITDSIPEAEPDPRPEADLELEPATEPEAELEYDTSPGVEIEKVENESDIGQNVFSN